MSPEEQIIQHYLSGEALVRSTRGIDTERRYGAPYWQMHRADLHRVLLQAVLAADPDCLVLNARLQSFRQDGNSVRLAFSDRESVRASVLIGCDGVKSTVRNQLFGDGAPQFTGFAIWRGLVTTASVPAAALEIPAGVFIGPDRMMARYQLRQGTLLNYAAAQRREEWTDEGWTIRAPVSELLETFSDFHPAARAILAATPPELCFRWGLFSREPLKAICAGRVALLGDAAHPTLPFLGQGANLAIEDGLVLARALTAADDPVEALKRYEKARLARGELVMRQSLAAVENFFSTTAEGFNTRRMINEENLGLFEYDAATVPV